jgi:uncharacterized protein YjbI with pentapeptide repeats
MMRSSADRRCPWVGPQPYTEKDADYFLGRADELTRLQYLLSTQRLTVLTASSGSGKTSLIQAGLLPALRRLRAAEPTHTGPVLLLRNWGRLRERTPARLVVEAITAEIARLDKPEQGVLDRLHASDARRMARVQVPSAKAFSGSVEQKADAVIRYVGHLCDAVGPLILLFDQAEELLGSGLDQTSEELEREVLETLGTLFRHEERVRILISLRQEYVGRLRHLERLVGVLAARELHLEPLRRSTVSDVIEKTAKRAPRLSIGDGVADAVIGWLCPQDDNNGDAKAVDLLTLQALLVEIFHFTRTRSREGEVRITRKVLERFAAGQDTRVLARTALTRYVENLFCQQSPQRIPTNNVAGLMKRSTARMARWLSSPGGYKRHEDEIELALNAVREDMDRLWCGLDMPADYEAALRHALSDLRVRRSDAALASLFSRVTGQATAQEVRSGVARTCHWSVGKTAKEIVSAAFEALDLLERNNVVKTSQGGRGGRRSYELVHDGFGPALNDWASSYVRSAEDTLSSVVASLGTSFQWRALSGLNLHHLSWRGCSLDGVRLEDVCFTSCDLRGVIFSGCELSRCRFIGCDLSGAVFRGGRWNDVRWERSTASSLLVDDVIWRDVHFSRSVLSSGTILAVTLEGPRALSIERLVGRGCAFVNMVLPGLQFKHSDLKGSIFINCELIDTQFRCCDLSGSVFERGIWTKTAFRQCRASSAFIRGVAWRDVSVLSTDMDGVTASIELRGPARLSDTSFRFGQVQSRALHAKGKAVADHCDFSHCLVRTDRDDRWRFASTCRAALVVRTPPGKQIPKRRFEPRTLQR